MLENIGSRKFEFKDPRQERIYRRLGLVGPGPAAFYRDACLISSESASFEASSHIVGHLFREIDSALRDVLRPGPKPKDGAKNSQTIDIKTILQQLEISEEDVAASAWLSMARNENDSGLHKRAHRKDLDRPRIFDATFFEMYESILDVLLAQMELRYAAYFSTIDEIISGGFTTASIVQLRTSVPNSYVALKYFFDQLDDRNWLVPLAAAGFYAEPPEPQWSDDGRTVRFPSWPQIEYLVRVANSGADPSQIVQILNSLPTTENLRVQEAVARIALTLPSELSETLVPMIQGFVAARSGVSLDGFLGEHLGKLVSHLSSGGRVNAALALASTLLMPPNTEIRELAIPNDYKEHVIRHLSEPSGVFDNFHYDEIARENVPDLVAAAGFAAIDLLCECLDGAISSSDSVAIPEDYLDVWWPEIEEDGVDKHFVAGIRGSLIAAIRDGMELLIRVDVVANLPIALHSLRSHPWRIYRRLEMHFIRLFAAELPTIAEEAILDLSNLRYEPIVREYKLLIRDHFAKLSTDQQETILNAIEFGPNRENDRLLQETLNGVAPSEEELDALADRWRRLRLSPIREHLSPNWKERFGVLFAETLAFETSESPGVVSGDFLFAGPTSPLTYDELSQRTVHDIKNILNTWEPGGGWMAPDREGLARTLSSAVRANPKRFADEALELFTVNPIYLWGVFHGLWLAAQDGALFDWGPVLSLFGVACARWESAEDKHQNESWRWVKGEIADLLRMGFGPGELQIPFELRVQSWNLIESLALDPSPSPDEESDDIDSADIELVALNSIRGKVLYGVVLYALWVIRNNRITKDPTIAGSPASSGFDEIPEVRSLLDAHLDLTFDPSVAVRSIYGSQLPWLVDIDADWVQEKLGSIFPSTEGQDRFRTAAWNAYVRNRLYNKTFEVMRAEYASSITQIAKKGAESDAPTKSLGGHLVAAYFRGLIDLAEADNLLAQYFVAAPADARKQVLESLGRALQQPDMVDAEAGSRLRALWEWRFPQLTGPDQPGGAAEEAAQFVHWYVAGILDEEWALDQLSQVLSFSKRLPQSYRVVERLIPFVEKEPEVAAKILQQIVIGEEPLAGVFGWHADHTRELLSRILASQEERAIQAAVEIINLLAAGGHVGFRDLLPTEK